MSSEYKIYRGSKRIEPTGNLPLLVIAAQKDKGTGFSEHYIFPGVARVPFLRKSTGYGPGRSVSETDFEQMVTLDAILASEFDRAKAHFENSLFELDKSLHRHVFWEGHPFEYPLVDDFAFRHLAMAQQHKKEIAEMFAFTNCFALEPLEKLSKVLALIHIKSD